MLNQLKNFLSRSPPPPLTKPLSSPPCTHPYCAHHTQCLKTLGEESISHSSHHSLNTLISDHFSGHEVDIDCSWDSDNGWAEFCHRCHQERCQRCEGAVFTQVTRFADVLTFESCEVWICAPCRHGRCPGWKVKIVSKCGGCKHTSCADCMLSGDEKKGIFCCQCAKEGRKLENRAQGKTLTETQYGLRRNSRGIEQFASSV
jgi:hypothetical protein